MNEEVKEKFDYMYELLKIKLKAENIEFFDFTNQIVNQWFTKSKSKEHLRKNVLGRL